MDIPINENKLENILEKDILEEDKNKNILKEEKIEFQNFDNINSPQLIQDILHLSSHSTQNCFQHQNNLIKSLYSLNDLILPALEEDSANSGTVFNPKINFLNNRNKLHLMNFNQINSQNNFLIEEIRQYNDLKRKISDYKSSIIFKGEEKENTENNQNLNNKEDIKKELNSKLILVNHPLINLFKEDIDITQLKDDLQKEYLKGMRDNTNYKPVPYINNLINILNNSISENNEENELQENSLIISQNSGEEMEEVEEEINVPLHPHQEEEGSLESVENVNNQNQVNENIDNPIAPINNEEHNEIANIENEPINVHHNENEENNIDMNNGVIQPIIQQINEINNNMQIQIPLVLQPNQPLEPIYLNEPIENIEEIPLNIENHIENNNNIGENVENIENANTIQNDENQNEEINNNQNMEENEENNDL